MIQIRFYTCKPKFQKKATNFPYKTNHKNSFFLGFCIWVLGFPFDIFVNGYIEIPMNTNLFNILWFSCQGKSRDIVHQSNCLFWWWIFVQHGLFGILLTAYSVLSRLTNHGIYFITRCGLWMLTIFHISDIHLQRELRKVTPQKLYLSFLLFSIYTPRTCILGQRINKGITRLWLNDLQA